MKEDEIELLAENYCKENKLEKRLWYFIKKNFIAGYRKKEQALSQEIESLREEVKNLKALRETFSNLNNKLSEDLRTANGKIYQLSERKELFEWVKLSENFPDPPEYWLASNTLQNGKYISLRIDGVKIAAGRLVKIEGKFCLCYSTNQIFDEEAGFLKYEDFYRVEWLKPVKAKEQQGNEELYIKVIQHFNTNSGNDWTIEELAADFLNPKT